MFVITVVIETYLHLHISKFKLLKIWEEHGIKQNILIIMGVFGGLNFALIERM